MRKTSVWLCGFVLLCLAGAVFCGWNLYQNLMPRAEAEAEYERIRAVAFPNRMDSEKTVLREEPNLEALYSWNPDIRGWIYAPDTTIDYPIVQGTDNEYYLNHTADRKKNVIGSIFIESRNHGDFSDDVTVLYGHHIQRGRMFSSLSGYKKQAYYDKHPFIMLDTSKGRYRVELFAGQIMDGNQGGFPLIFADKEERDIWLEGVITSSTFQSEIYPGEEERILALCTCSYESQDARYVVYGVLREIE